MTEIWFTLVLLLSSGHMIESDPLPSKTVCIQMLAGHMQSTNVVMGQCIKVEMSVEVEMGKGFA